MNKTLDALIEFFSDYRKVCIAYTCGLENPILTRAALEAGCDVLALAAETPMIKAADVEHMGGILSNIYKEIRNGYLAHSNMNIEPEMRVGQFNCIKLENDVLSISSIKTNSANRCYYCKKAVIGRMIYLARKLSCDILVDSTYYADEFQLRANEYMGVVNPLHLIEHRQVISDLAQEGIYGRFYSRRCLADCFLTDAQISLDGLRLAEEVNEALDYFGLMDVSFKIHGDLIRIKGEHGGLKRLAGIDSAALNRKLTGLGISYATVDLNEEQAG